MQKGCPNKIKYRLLETCLKLNMKYLAMQMMPVETVYYEYELSFLPCKENKIMLLSRVDGF